MSSVAFVGSSDSCNDVVTSGEDDGAIHLHGARALRGVVLVRVHARSVVQLLSSGGWALVSGEGESVKLWDALAKICVRTISGGLFVEDEEDTHFLMYYHQAVESLYLYMNHAHQVQEPCCHCLDIRRRVG